MNKIIKEALVLMAITLVSGLLLGAVYSITKQPIAQAEEKAQKEAYLAVFPDAQDLTEPDNKEELLTEAADVLDQAGFGTADTLEDFYLAEKDGAVTGVVMNITSHACKRRRIQRTVRRKNRRSVRGYKKRCFRGKRD